MQHQQVMEPQFNVQGGHMVMYHQDHTGLPQVKDATVNDRDRMQDLLAQEKYLTHSYNIAMQEASHDALVKVIKQNFDDVHQLQRQLFNAMFQKGWYKLPVAGAEAVAHTADQWNKYKTQFPFPNQRQGASAVSQPVQTATQAQIVHAAKTPTQADAMVKQAAEQAIAEASQGKVPHGLTATKTH